MKKQLWVALLSATAFMSSSVLASEPAEKPSAWTAMEWTKTLKDMPQGDVQRGADLHRDAFCMTCHGENGVAPSRNAPSLASQPAEYIYKTLIDYQSGLRDEGNGKALLMRAATEPMSAQDMADLATFYAEQALPIRVEKPLDAKIDRLTRKGDFSRLVVACASCHGAQGEGNGISPALAGQTSDYFIRTMRAYKDKHRTNDINEGMAQFTYNLTDDEITALADYYASFGKGE